MLLNRIQSNFMCNELPVMCTAHGECTIITVRYQMEYLEHKSDEQTDSHSGYSAHVHFGQFTGPGITMPP